MTRWSARVSRQFLLATAGIALLLSVAVVPEGAVAQGLDYGHRLGLQRGGEVSYEPVGSGVLFDALDPAVRRWYVPQELFLLYRWKQWEYTNYARDHYQRYLSPDIEGDYFYDLYGSFYHQRMAHLRLAPAAAAAVRQRHFKIRGLDRGSIGWSSPRTAAASTTWP